jgi:hypothetical protein
MSALPSSADKASASSVRAIIIRGSERAFFGKLAPCLYMRLCNSGTPMKDVLSMYRLALQYKDAGILNALKPVLLPRCPHCGNTDPRTISIDTIAELLHKPCFFCLHCNGPIFDIAIPSELQSANARSSQPPNGSREEHQQPKNEKIP